MRRACTRNWQKLGTRRILHPRFIESKLSLPLVQMMLIDVRLVKEKGDLYVADFARQMYRKCGMRVLVVVAFIDPDEQLNIPL